MASSTDVDEDEDVPLDMVIGHPDGDDGLTLEERQELEVDEEEAAAAAVMRSSQEEADEGPFADSSVEEEEGKGKAAADPFLDPRPRPHPRTSPRITVSPAVEDSGLPRVPVQEDPSSIRRSHTQNSLDAPPPSEIRIFRSPSYLTTPELRDLIDSFPNFISIRCRSLRFNSQGCVEKHGKEKDSTNTLIGHGQIRISVFEKDEQWKGTFVERIKLLLFRIFGI